MIVLGDDDNIVIIQLGESCSLRRCLNERKISPVNSPSSTFSSRILPIIALVGLCFLGILLFPRMFLAPGRPAKELQSVSSHALPEFHVASNAPRCPSPDDSEIEEEVFADEELDYLADEILLKVGSKAEVVELLRLAMANGGEFVDAVAALKTFRLRFDSREQAEAFRDQLGDDYQSENNYLVKAPDFPDVETRDDSEPQTLSHTP